VNLTAKENRVYNERREKHKRTLNGLDGVNSRTFLTEQRKERVLAAKLTVGCVKV